MAILIDQPVNYGKGMIYSRMVSDVNLKELHNFAKALGLKKNNFEVTNTGHAFYKVTISKRFQAIEKSALEADVGVVMKAAKNLNPL